MADDKLIETDEDELVAVETPPKDEGKTEPKAEPKADAEADAEEDDDEEDDKDEGDARLAESQDDSEDDISPNRKRRLKRREVRKRAKDNAERELHFLREQNNELMRRVSAVEGHALSTNAQTLDQRMNEALRDAQQAETIMARAVEAGNGDDMATALRLRDEANRRAWELSQSKQQVEQVRQQVANPGPDPRVRSLAQEWLTANPWYDSNGRDEDSRITKAIEAVAKEAKALEGRLSNPAFVEKAKPEAVEKARADHAEKSAEVERLGAALARLG
jgi:valyl-tRNA synthetase